MSEKFVKCGTDEWIPSLKELCLSFLDKLNTCPGGQYLKFRDDLGTKEQPGKIVNEYHDMLPLIKREIFGNSCSHELIDHHKIASLFIFVHF